MGAQRMPRPFASFMMLAGATAGLGACDHRPAIPSETTSTSALRITAGRPALLPVAGQRERCPVFGTREVHARAWRPAHVNQRDLRIPQRLVLRLAGAEVRVET